MQNMDQEESKMGTENGESKLGTENGESKLGTENEESKLGTRNEESKVDTRNEESKVDTENEEIKMDTENEEIKMDTKNEESKMDPEKDVNKTVTKNPLAVSSNPDTQSSENVDSKKDTDPAEGSNKQELSEKNTPRSLKAKKIVKKSLAAKLKAKKIISSPQILRKRIIRKTKKVGSNAESSHNAAAEKQISDNTQQMETNDEPPKGKSMEVENNEVNTEIDLPDKAEQEQKSKEKSKKRYSRRKNKGKQNGKEKSPSEDINSERLDKKSERLHKKSERLGGLIFMCNAKTKPDCFRYRVMGVSATKKEDILRVKPGLKLFLYDFDLKLLYGIFKASSSGGMNLERKAFGGKFAAQVRFSVVSDCFPLPENVFKKAIKDNYNEKHKFKTELTLGQVTKLTRLFRPVGVHLAEQPIYSPPKPIVREREVPARIRGRYSDSHRERTAKRQSELREEVPRDSYRIDKNYRAYGHQGDRRNVATSSRAIPVSEPYERDYERHVLDPCYRSAVPARVESLRVDPLYLDRRGHHNYTRVVSDHIEDPYAYPYSASPRDAYLTPLGREDIASSSHLVRGRSYNERDSIRRREILPDRHYSIYSAADALSEYDRMQPYHGGRLEVSPVRVAFRYSFVGPSYSRR